MASNTEVAEVSSMDKYSWNCREEMDGHVQCVKLFLEEHVKHDIPYVPGGGPEKDHCATTRNLYLKCMEVKKKHPSAYHNSNEVVTTVKGPKRCEMELAIHGNCVAQQLEKAVRLGEKYWTQGGEDKCALSRKHYEKCMRS